MLDKMRRATLYIQPDTTPDVYNDIQPQVSAIAYGRPVMGVAVSDDTQSKIMAKLEAIEEKNRELQQQLTIANNRLQDQLLPARTEAPQFLYPQTPIPQTGAWQQPQSWQPQFAVGERSGQYMPYQQDMETKQVPSSFHYSQSLQPTRTMGTQRFFPNNNSLVPPQQQYPPYPGVQSVP